MGKVNNLSEWRAEHLGKFFRDRVAAAAAAGSPLSSDGGPFFCPPRDNRSLLFSSHFRTSERERGMLPPVKGRNAGVKEMGNGLKKEKKEGTKMCPRLQRACLRAFSSLLVNSVWFPSS